MGKYFGTDGIRGVANEELTAQLSYHTGLALAHVLREGGGERPKVLVGRDTRISGTFIESALEAGLCAGGADVMPLGVLPTPAVAFMVMQIQAQAGVVISASHNSFEHNGIKIFGSDGFKLPDEREVEIERLIDDPLRIALQTGEDMGRVLPIVKDATGAYCQHVMGSAQAELKGLRLLIDCANGAAFETAHVIFERLGCDCTFMFDRPDGININNGCGSTHIGALCEKMKGGGFDLGVAFDGDADRCSFVDERGELINGDAAIALLACSMQRQGQLKGGVVLTVLSNLGVHAYLNGQGVKTLSASVGDRFVLEMMRKEGMNVGGEQSGHIILSDFATTGDGQLSAVQFACLLRQSGEKASQLHQAIAIYPQETVNVRVPNALKQKIANHPLVLAEAERITRDMGGKGRVLIRPSGTEALVRVMVEGQDPGTVRRELDRAAEAVRSAASS